MPALLNRDGFQLFDCDPQTAHWAARARDIGAALIQDPGARAGNLRHGGTWFVGVDALPNDDTGALPGAALNGPWHSALPAQLPLHKAQLSITFPGYPERDPGQTPANHRFRVQSFAAHMDGLLPEGQPPRRAAREFHAYILGLPLSGEGAAPTMIWPGSHILLRNALTKALTGAGPGQNDITEVYSQTRKQILRDITPVPIDGPPGSAFLIHRFALHGMHPWSPTSRAPHRMTAFFRPQYPDLETWLSAP